MVEYKFEYRKEHAQLSQLHEEIAKQIKGFQGLRTTQGQETVAIFDRELTDEEKSILANIINTFVPKPEPVITLVAYEGLTKEQETILKEFCEEKNIKFKKL
jgi:hypothetical protein